MRAIISMKQSLVLILSALIILSPLMAVFASEEYHGLRISEVMASNNLLAIDGRACDWIEIHNAGDTAIDLAGFGLSDRAALPYLARISGILASGEYKVFAADDAGLGFSLSRNGEHIFLTSPQGHIIDEMSYENLDWDVSLMREGDGWRETWLPTPGEANSELTKDEADTKQYHAALVRGFVISEVMAANGEYALKKPTEDWVELYNPTGEMVTLEGFYLSDNAGNLKRWPFPRGYKLQPGVRVAVYCAGGNGDAIQTGGGVLANRAFTLNKTGGAVILSDGQTIIDSVSMGQQFGNISYGRPEGQGAFRFFNQTTFLKPNPDTGSTRRLEDVAYSHDGGFVDKPFILSLDTQQEETIRYTLDGSEPMANSSVYVQPISIAKNTVVRAFSELTGWINSPITTHTYLFDHLPQSDVVCVTGDPCIFFGGYGIFEQKNNNTNTQYRVNLEIFENNDAKINQQVSLKLTGGTSQVFLPRTFTVYARSGLGENTFAYNPFRDRGYLKYTALTLRNGGTDAFRTRIRDAFLTSLAQGYNLMYLASAPAIVYVNGQFWGAMNLRERANKDAIAQWEGITDPDLIDGIIIVKNRGIEVRGSKEELVELAAFCRNNDLNNRASLNHVLSVLDVDSLFAHTAFEIISGNGDISNVRYYRVPGGKWKLLLFDLDLSMMNSNPPPIDFYNGNWRDGTKYNFGELFRSLMQVPQMRERFFMLAGRILRERFTEAFLTVEMDRWQAVYEPLMKLHAARWSGFSYSTWQQSMDTFRAVLIKRPRLVVKYLRQSYSLDDIEAERYFGEFMASGQ